MIELTTSFIKKKYLQQHSQKRLKKKVDENYLKKITHLFMNEQYIDEINDFSTCKNLKVIYLQKNFIKQIENLDFAVKLTHLYLQHNEITKIEHLDYLINLKKLYLGYNRIAIIEGLDNLLCLSELHIEKQKLPPGEILSLNSITAHALSGCLIHLNISDNQLTSLKGINNFKKLIKLEAQYNLINDVEDLIETIKTLPRLKNLFLKGNPVTQIYRYRENLIANSHSLITLDEKYITEYSRNFLHKFKCEKINQSRKQFEMPLSEDITNSLKLPPAFKKSVTRAIFQNINPQLSFSEIVEDSQSQSFQPWKSSLSINALRNNRILPRPFWKNKIKTQKL